MLLLILGVFMLIVTWMPKLGRIGGERGRFAVLGFFATFLGVFVSATGSLLAPFLASHTPNRYKMVATMGALMTITHIAKLFRVRLHRLRDRQLPAADGGDDRVRARSATGSARWRCTRRRSSVSA